MASGPDRLICQRRAAACALYRPASDPLERHDLSAEDPARFDAMRALLARRSSATTGATRRRARSAWPEPLRRGLQGEVEAAPDVASLLDDADVAIRRKAAEVCFALHAPATGPEVKRALARDEDDEVRRWAALALARMGEPMPPLAEALLRDPGRDWRRRAALALGERGDARGCDEMAAWWSEAVGGPAAERRTASRRGCPWTWRTRASSSRRSARARCRAAVPALARGLEDVRARPYVADALGALGDDRARSSAARGPRKRAVRHDAPEGSARLARARGTRLVGGGRGASRRTSAPRSRCPAGAARLVVLLSDPHAELAVSAEGEPDPAPPAREPRGETAGDVRVVELEPRPQSRRVRLDVRASPGRHRRALGHPIVTAGPS